MKILIRTRDIIGGYTGGPDPYECRFQLLPCLPRNAAGLYEVSHDGRTFEAVSNSELWNYPVVRINTFCGDAHLYQDYEDELEDLLDGYEGVNDQGISLLAFEIEGVDIENYELYLDLPPSFISVWKGKIQLIFQLRDFVPGRGKATTNSLIALEKTRRTVEDILKGKRTSNLINPLCKEVRSYIYKSGCTEDRHGLTFDDIKRIVREGHNYKKRADGGRGAAAVRAKKTKEKIMKAIFELQAEETPITQKAVLERSGVSRQKVNKHWKTVRAEYEERHLTPLK